MNILIVDDSKAMRMLVERGLRQSGYGACEFTEASNGFEALAAIEKRSPDLILSDTDMPQMTGFELLNAVTEQGIDVKFGFVTSESTPAFRREALDAGALFLIAKPFAAEDLSDALARAGIWSDGGGDPSTIPPRLSLPTRREVAELMSVLLQREVSATDSSSLFFNDREPRIVGDYVNDEGCVAAVTVCNLGFANRAAAALSMLSSATAEEAIKTGKVEGVLLQNLHEVLNVMVQFHNDGDRPPVKFRSTSPIPGLLPRDVKGLYSRPGARRTYDVCIQGYGDGRISLMVN
ncbi:MAG: response regulator [Actinomycetota bacterium]